MTITAAEQYLIELINRARLDPQAEADRYLGGDLNLNNSGTQLVAYSREPLAGNTALHQAATAHSLHMLAVDEFEHRNIGDGTPTSRMEDAGYDFNGSWSSGENISVRGTTGSMNLNTAISSHHSGLFISTGHRKNILSDSFREIGVGQEAGGFSGFQNNSTNYNASMLTENFARTGGDIFITGVVYNDSNTNDFYNIGEGVGGTSVAVSGIGSAISASAGGYAIDFGTASGARQVSATGMTVTVTLAGENIKLDFLANGEVHSSSSVTLNSGVTTATLLGTDSLAITGNAAGEVLTGNSGSNTLRGNGGNDLLDGGGGADNLIGGLGHDIYVVDHAGDRVTETGLNFDIIRTSVTANLSSNLLNGAIEAVTLTGTASINAIGNLLSNILTGNSAANVINGLTGADNMRGRGGADTYVVDNAGDVVDETLAGSFGYDRILSSVNINLSNSAQVRGALERIELQGNANIQATGNALANVIQGNSGNNMINGLAGNDVLTGGAGADSFVFSAPLGNTNLDRILDFDTNADRILLDDTIFGGLGTSGPIANNELRVFGTGAQDANDFLLHNPINGFLYYDADANGADSAQLFAIIGAGTDIDAGDFAIV